MSLSSLMEEYDLNVQMHHASDDDDIKSEILDRIAELEILIRKESENYFNNKDGGMNTSYKWTNFIWACCGKILVSYGKLLKFITETKLLPIYIVHKLIIKKTK